MKKAKLTVWVYACSWLLGANKRIVGVEVVEHHAETDEAEYSETKGMGVWATTQRRDSVELTAWAREHYEGELSSTPIPIRDSCAKTPTIRVERFASAEAPPEPETSDEKLRKAREARNKAVAEAAVLRAEANNGRRSAFAEVAKIFRGEEVPTRQIVEYCEARVDQIDREACKPA